MKPYQEPGVQETVTESERSEDTAVGWPRSAIHNFEIILNICNTFSFLKKKNNQKLIIKKIRTKKNGNYFYFCIRINLLCKKESIQMKSLLK